MQLTKAQSPGCTKMLEGDWVLAELDRIGVSNVSPTTKQLNMTLKTGTIPVVTNNALEDIVGYSIDTDNAKLLDYVHENIVRDKLQSIVKQYVEGVDNALTRFLEKQMSSDYVKHGPVHTCQYLTLARDMRLPTARILKFYEKSAPACLIYVPDYPASDILDRETDAASRSLDRYIWLISSKRATIIYADAMMVAVTCITLNRCFTSSHSLKEFTSRFKGVMGKFIDEDDEDKMEGLFSAIAYTRTLPNAGFLSQYDSYYRQALIYCEVVYGTDLMELVKEYMKDSPSAEAECANILFGTR